MSSLPGSIAKRWRELNGEDNWKGLLDPLDIDLRYNIMLYGELVQAIGDTIILDERSPLAGMHRYARKNMLINSTVTLGQASLYKVTKYIYAAPFGVQDEFTKSYFVKPLSSDPSDVVANWMGFVAVATDAGKAALGRRDILVAWRGTMRFMEYIIDADFLLASATEILPTGPSGEEPKVHHGFLTLYDSARDQVREEIRRLVNEYKEEEVSITVAGHSLGCGLAALTAADIAANGFNKPSELPDKACPVAVFALASPRVGNAGFRDAFDATPDLRLLRITNQQDLVPQFPPTWLYYVDVGVELLMDYLKSLYLKVPEGTDLLCMAHYLECYLHGIDGTHGITEEFKLVINRDLTLLNKNMDALKDSSLAPPTWWVQKNKSMVKQHDGRWKVDEYYEPDDSDYLFGINNKENL